jgi:hypothetical protein
MPAPLRAVIWLSRTHSWPARLDEAAILAFGRLRLYRLQRGAAQLRKRMEQIRELGTVAEPTEAGDGWLL